MNACGVEELLGCFQPNVRLLVTVWSRSGAKERSLCTLHPVLKDSLGSLLMPEPQPCKATSSCNTQFAANVAAQQFKAVTSSPAYPPLEDYHPWSRRKHICAYTALMLHSTRKHALRLGHQPVSPEPIPSLLLATEVLLSGQCDVWTAKPAKSTNQCTT